MSAFGEALSLLCRLFLAGLFIWASHDKVWDPAAFAASTATYELLPLWAVNAASIWMAWLEMVCGLMLLLGLFTRAAAGCLALLLAMFTGLMIYAGITGAGFDCGCFPGEAAHAAGYSRALEDAAFLLASLWLLVFPGRWLALTRP